MEFLKKFKVIERPTEYIHQLKWNNKLAVALYREQFLSHGGNGNVKTYCFDYRNGIHEHAVSMLIRKNFSYTNQLNAFIRYARDSGLVTKWLSNYRSHEKEPPFFYRNFSLQAVSLLLAFIGSMLVGATCIMVLENIVNRKVQMHNSPPFWRYIEMLIDPNRYLFLNDYTS